VLEAQAQRGVRACPERALKLIGDAPELIDAPKSSG
jgi:hypothetical protein